MDPEIEFDADKKPETEAQRELRIAEATFNKGAAHGAQWLHEKARQMANNGASAQDVSRTLGEYLQVLLDWRNGNIEMPGGNPWEWQGDALREYIESHRREW